MERTRGHWEKVYATKAETAVSWYQPHSTRSLAYIKAAADAAAPIIDVGGGASTLVDDLLAGGHADITVLDLAQSALAKSRSRLGDKAAKVTWIAADITDWRPPRAYQVWHDRAVFHFLTEDTQQASYIEALKSGSRAGATIILATFALDGPDNCSGLPVERYSPQTLSVRLGPSFDLVDHARESHTTPWGSEQRFSYAVFRRGISN